MHTKRIAAIGILTILSFFVVLHGLILLGIVPFQIVWGGRLSEHSQMVVFELVSLVVNLLMILVVSVRAGWLRFKVKAIFLRLALWGMAGIFGLNTLGNALSTNPLEKNLFTPLTLLLCLGCMRLIIPEASSLGTSTGTKQTVL